MNQMLDKISKQLTHPSLLASFYPCHVQGDGNCQFRSASISLLGVETYHEEVRARTIIEMIMNTDKYLDWYAWNSDLWKR